jgi:hypothetical protein
MKDIFSGEYDPKHIPEMLDLNEWVFDDAGSKEKLKNQTLNKLNQVEQTPLTKAESHETQEIVKELIETIEYRQAQIKHLKKLADAQVKDFTLQLNTKNRALKQSLRRILKDTSGAVSYEQYKALLARKNEIESTEINDYVQGKF